MATKYCASCKKTVSREWPHSCYDADAVERRREAERKVVEAAVAYEKWQGKWYDYCVASGDKPAKPQREIMEAVRALRALDAREGGA